MKEVVVVGGGASGIIAAWRAASLGAKVSLLEKTDRLGTKIAISGGGKCNICHDGDIEDVLRAFLPNERLFLRPSVYKFPNESIVEMLTSRGLDVYTRPNGRIFPVHQSAKDVLAIFRRYLDEAGVNVIFGQEVSGVQIEAGAVSGLEVNGRTMPVTKLIVCVGGSSYPKTGSTGDGFRWMRKLGHSVLPIRAALAPIYLESIDGKNRWADVSGVSLQNVTLKARQNGKEIAKWHDDLLFTHSGISGPCALAVSRVVAEKLSQGTITLEIDLCQDRPSEELIREFLENSQKHPRRQVSTLIENLLPVRLQTWLLESAGVEPTSPLSAFPKKDRNRLAETVKRWEIGKVKSVPLERGEVVAGGVSLDEVDPKSMRSKLMEGLWLCGEILDIAGPVGGYNLQAAFATGYVAGESAAQS